MITAEELDFEIMKAYLDTAFEIGGTISQEFTDDDFWSEIFYRSSEEYNKLGSTYDSLHFPEELGIVALHQKIINEEAEECSLIISVTLNGDVQYFEKSGVWSPRSYYPWMNKHLAELVPLKVGKES